MNREYALELVLHMAPSFIEKTRIHLYIHPNPPFPPFPLSSPKTLPFALGSDAGLFVAEISVTRARIMLSLHTNIAGES